MRNHWMAISCVLTLACFGCTESGSDEFAENALDEVEGTTAIPYSAQPPAFMALDARYGTADNLPLNSQCGGNSPLLNPAPGSSRCRPDCGYFVDRGEAIIQLDHGNEVAFSHLSLVLHDQSGALEAFTLPNFGFAPGSKLKLTGIHPTTLTGAVQSVTFEATVEGDGYSSAVSGDIPIFAQP